MSAPAPHPPAGRTLRVLAMFPFFDEADKLGPLAEQIQPGLADEFVGVNDGSTDDGPAILRRYGVTVLDQERGGIGTCIRRCIAYARERGFDVMVVMAGNGKDRPAEIPRLLKPIFDGEADYVQGSRFLPGGSSPNLPVFRRVSIRLLSFLFRVAMRKPCTDLTNGFRAWRLSLLDDPRIDPWQDWLDTYEMEYYLHWKAYTLGYRVREVPVTKAYPAGRGVSYTKIKPFSGWWRMLRPFLLLALRIKR